VAKCGCSGISAGQLKTPITIERNTPVADGEGGYTDVWAPDPAGSVYSKVKPVGGSERWFAERVTPGNRYRFTIRFRGDGNGAPYYNESDRLKYNGRTLGIQSVVDIDDERRYIEILAIENKAS